MLTTLFIQLMIALGLYTSPLDDPLPPTGGGAIEIPGGSIGAGDDIIPIATPCEECP